MITPSERIAIINGERNVSFNEMLQHINDFASHLSVNKGDKVLVFSENREGWIYALYSIWAKRGIMVPVDANSTVHDVAYIMNDCRPQVIWTSREKEAMAREAIAESGVDIKVLLIDDYEMNEVKALPQAKIEYNDEDTCLICYTSGTTGSPKGVMLSFMNIMANVNAVWKEVHIFDEEQRTIVLLPLHHVLPLVGTAIIPMVTGCGVVICPSLSAQDIMGSLQKGKVGIMIGVPRLWQTLYRGIKGKVDANFLTRALYNICDKMQSRTLSRLVFKSVRQKMGGRIKYCVSGGAALDADTARGLKTLGLDVLEGYGMTEAAPIIAFTRPGDIIPGCVGLPMPSVQVKLIDGELCAKGKGVMQGYYNRPEETAAIIDKDGYLHTGDLAEFDEKGRITITGRKKEIIVLSNGKNVNPAEIEEKLEHYVEIVKEAAVTQNGDMLCAIIVPQEQLSRTMTPEQLEEYIKNELLQPYNKTVAPYKKLMNLIVYKGDLPRTRLDKLQRFKLKDIVEGKADSSANTSSQNDIEPDTQEYKILKDYISVEKRMEVRPTDNLETDLGMDSLDKVALQGFIEQSFGVNMSSDALMAFKSIADIAEHIASTKTKLSVEDIDWNMILTNTSGKLNIPKMATTGIIFTRLCKWFYSMMFKVKVNGMENIPTGGPVILAPNHQSFLDGPLVVTHMSSKTLRNTYFYAKKDHVRGPIMRMLAHNHNVVIMDMNTLKDSISTLGKVLGDGKNLVIFPEGTRTRNGKVGAFKKTFAILAKELNVPVVPVRISGAFEAWPRQNMLPRPHKVEVEYLNPVRCGEGESYDDFADRIRKIIAE